MKIYNYHPVTGEYLNSTYADESPAEAGEFLIPKHATAIAPLEAGAGQVSVFSDGAWSLLPDHRGSVWYDPAGNSVEISEIGNPDQALSQQLPPAIALARDQTARCNALSGAYNTEIQRDVPYMGTEFQADDASQIALTKVLAAGSVPDGFFWLDVRNAQIPMSYAVLQGLASAILVQGQAAFAKLQMLKSQVRAAATVGDVQAVIW